MDVIEHKAAHRSTPRAMISVTAATGLLEVIEKAGRDADKILSVVGIKRSVLRNADGFIPVPAFSWLLDEAARLTRDDYFGLHFGERFDPKDIRALSFLVLNSPTLGAAMENIERYMCIHNNAARVSFTIEDGRGYLRFGGGDWPARQHNEYSLAVTLKTLRAIAGDAWVPLAVQVANKAPQETAEHERIFRSPVHFGQPMNALVIDPSSVRQASAMADERLYEVLKQHLERVLLEMPSESNLAAAVRRTIVDVMATGSPTRERVAQALSTTPHKLSRQLKEQHRLSYEDLVSEVRDKLAREYLKDPNRTVTEVAFLLGYSEVSAFTRAFKRSHGVAPQAYRRHSARGRLEDSPLH